VKPDDKFEFVFGSQFILTAAFAVSRPSRASKRMAVTRIHVASIADGGGRAQRGAPQHSKIAGLEHYFVGYVEDNESPEVSGSWNA
jgi:hypothetical protein